MTSGADGDSYHSGGFLFRVMPPSWQPAPAGIRNGHSEGGPFFFAATKIRIGRGTAPPQRRQQAKPFFFAATKIRIGRGRSLPLRNQQAKPFSPASIRKSGPEIKNHCPLEDVSGGKLAAIAKFTPSNQESLHAGGRFQAKTCSDS